MASSAVAGMRRRETNSVVGAARLVPSRRRQMSSDSWMPVFSEKFTRFGSCEVTTRSTLKRSARKRRSGSPEAPIQAVAGSTLATVPRSLSAWSASVVKEGPNAVGVDDLAGLLVAVQQVVPDPQFAFLHPLPGLPRELLAALVVRRERRVQMTRSTFLAWKPLPMPSASHWVPRVSVPWSLEALEKSVGAWPSLRDRRISSAPALTVPSSWGPCLIVCR